MSVRPKGPLRRGMPRRWRWSVALGALALLVAGLPVRPVHAMPPTHRLAVLRRGVSITNWFRFPVSPTPTALRTYLSDPAITGLKRAGFTALRLPVQPEVLGGDRARMQLLVAAIRRIEHHGLAVVVVPYPTSWHLETSASDRAALLAFWTRLAPLLRPLDPGLTFPEVLNEPVFPGNAESWSRLQHRVLAALRTHLPDNTVLLTGNDWGSIAGLLALRPDPDPNVIYSFHFYEPADLTSLAAYRHGLDRAALARLPFPADDRAACFRVADASTDAPTAALIRFYCGLHWDDGRIDRRIAAAAAWGRRNHAAVLLGEFGATAALNATARVNWLQAVRRSAEQHGIGWMLWGYDDVMGFDLSRPPPSRPRLSRGVLRALGLAVPP